MSLLSQCSPLLITVDESCGCTLTRASVKSMKPSDFEDLFWKEVGMSRIVANWKEARMTGVPQRALTDLLLSRMVPLKRVNLTPGNPQQSVIAPYVLIPKQHRINANYFAAESGTATTGAGSGSIPASAWDLTINWNYDPTLSPTRFATPLVNIEKYFLPGQYVVVLYKDDEDTGRTVQFKVLNAVNADSGGVSKAILTLQPSITDATWAGYGRGEKAPYQPTHGLVIPLTNSISNYESWCYNEAAELTWSLKALWLQTFRRTHCYNEEYLKAIEAPLTDPLFKQFRLMPLALQKKRQLALAQAKMWNTVMFGREINENQTVETYADLPQVIDPANGGCVLEYKANTIGIMRQLEECTRVIDYSGADLNFDLLKEALYILRRTREAGGADSSQIDVMTDRYTASNILTLMIRYYKDKYGYDVTRFYQPGQALKFEGQVLWNFNKYEFPEEGVTLNVIVDPFFDDHLANMPTADKTMGRYFMMVDWSDIEIGISQVRSVNRQTNIADNLYNCVVDPIITHYQLWSETMSVMVNDPNRSLIWRNFSGNCPSLTSDPCEPYTYEQ